MDGRNPAPVDTCLIQLLRGFQPCFLWCRISRPSTVLYHMRVSINGDTPIAGCFFLNGTSDWNGWFRGTSPFMDTTLWMDEHPCSTYLSVQGTGFWLVAKWCLDEFDDDLTVTSLEWSFWTGIIPKELIPTISTVVNRYNSHTCIYVICKCMYIYIISYYIISYYIILYYTILNYIIL